ncbi:MULTISPECIES: DUF1120 domain-containing protein [unclassified Serratia (in: enterobacteria)]|uniref:DUF1120 domain-containing protein n=1 Tax=unclassified Serratia (in: enterobacteria) TaxID=2647522 RepID=UPI000508B85C|nr:MULTISPECIES: DUF1120 domain-containing protein [unclassified Serratia (in: enterobacteria)]KFK93539.1 hypothetical protein JV45_16160 [Serratia sp. Ag2]KFL00490.1 hypothetical protein IV04_00425 [Serratia sp. Ag1]
MLNHLQKTVCALAVLATTSLPVLAGSIDVRVIGTIDPAACTPTLSGGGTVDYGTIKPTALTTDAFTVLPEKQLDFAINCDAPAKVAITAHSQRGASAVKTDGTLTEIASIPGIFGSTGSTATVGLGLDGTKGIGGYAIRLAAGTMTADGVAVDSIISNSNTTSWGSTLFGNLFTSIENKRYSSWAKTGTTTPIAFTTLAGKLGVQAYINKASELDLTKPVVLDGLTTLELVYL